MTSSKIVFSAFLLLCASLAPVAQSMSEQAFGEPAVSKLNYEAVPDFFQLPPGENFVEVAHFDEFAGA